MEPKIKVLHIGEYVNGGVATYLKILIKNSNKYGIEPYLLMSEFKSERNWMMPADCVNFYRYSRSLCKLIPAILQIKKSIQKINPNVIHIHSTWAGVLVRILYILGLKKKGTKIIYSPHGWSFLMESVAAKKVIYVIIERILSLVTDKIINISQYEYDKAVSFGIDKKKMLMIYNGVDDVHEIKDKSFVVDQNKINLLFVGRLDRQKGLDLFLKPYYEEGFLNIHLYVIGSGILADKKTESDQKTTYLGWVKNEELDFYYQACDAVIMPSRWEGFGLVAIEAMRNSKPLIVSNRGALPELVKNKFNGYVFDLSNENELKDIMRRLTKDELVKMGKVGRRFYEMKFSEEIFIEKTFSLYV